MSYELKMHMILYLHASISLTGSSCSAMPDAGVPGSLGRSLQIIWAGQDFDP